MDSGNTKEKTFPLHKIIRQRNIHKLKIILLHVKDINEKNKYGSPPLVYACEQENNEEMLEILFKQNRIDPLASDIEGQNALHLLAFKGKFSWIQKFLKKFPDVPVDVETKEGNTPLIMAAKMDHVEIIEFFLKKGADINHQNRKKFTALHYAANNGNLKSAGRLIELGAEINLKDNRDCTPLMKCCSWNYLDICQLLLLNDADIHAKDMLGNTALSLASRRGYYDIVEILLKHGAEVNAVSKGEYMTYTPLVSACLGNNVKMLKILLEHGADVNHPGQYSQALFNCIKGNFLSGVKLLINAKANLYGRHPFSKKSPLEFAKKLRHYEIAQVIERQL